MTFMLKLILILRRIFEKALFDKFAPKNWRDLPDLDDWNKVKELSASQFDWKINAYKYQSDQLAGLLDNSHPLDEPQYFFKDLPYARDCDNWSRVWVQYYIYHGKECQEWVVTNKKHPFKKSHFIAVVKDDEGWRLLNYHRYPMQHETPEEAIADICGWNHGDYDDDVRLQACYRTYKS